MGNVTKEYLIKQLKNHESQILDKKYPAPYTAGNGIDITNGVISTDLGTAAGKNFTTYVAPGVTDIPIGASVYAAITSAARGVIRPAGSKTCAQLTSDLLVQANVGNVYKVTDSGVTTELFVGGAGHTIHENDDVIVVYGGSEGVFKFDLQNGVVDMTDYQKKELDQPITVGGTEETTVEGTLESLNTNKVDNVTGKGLSTNDYDNTEKQKVANAIQKSQTAGLVKNDGTVDTTAYAKQNEMSVTNGTGADADKTTIQLKTGTSATVLKAHQDITGKADKVSNATAGDIATLDANGNLVDSGISKDIIPSNTSASNKLVTDNDVSRITKSIYLPTTNSNVQYLKVTVTGLGDAGFVMQLNDNGGNIQLFVGHGTTTRPKKLYQIIGNNDAIKAAILGYNKNVPGPYELYIKQSAYGSGWFNVTSSASQTYQNDISITTEVLSNITSDEDLPSFTALTPNKLVTESETIVRYDLTASANTLAAVKTALETFYASSAATFRTPYCGYITASGAVWWYEFEKVDGNYGYGELRYYDTNNTWYTFRVGTGVFEYQPVLNAELTSASATFTPASGYEILDWGVCQLGNHVWGTFVLRKTNGDIPNSQTEIGNFSHTLKHAVNSVCFCSNNRYGGGAFYTGYLFIDNTGKTLIGNPSGTTTGINHVKISIDFCLT